MIIKRKSRMRIPAFCFLSVVCFSTLVAQRRFEIPDREVDPIDKEQYWANIGAGIAIRECYLGGPVGINLSYRNRSSLYSARFIYISGGSVFLAFPAAHGGGGDGCQDRQLATVKDVSVLYGFIEKERWTLASISVGPSVIFHTFEHEDSRFFNRNVQIENLTSLGLAIDAQGFITFSPRLGVGVHAFVNINTTASLGGVMLSLQIGKLW